MVFFLLACVPKAPVESPTESPIDSPAPPALLYVSSYFGDAVHRYDPQGQARATLPVLGPQTVVQHGAELIVVAEKANQILRFDAATGTALGTLIADDPATEADETGGLSGPTAAVFGPDGRWYVASFNTDAVLRYDADGRYLDTFVPAGTDGLDGPDIGMVFDGQGRLLVPGYDSNTLHVFGPDGTPQAPLLGPDQGLLRPRGVAIDGDGTVWVASRGGGAVLGWSSEGLRSLPVRPRPAGIWLRDGELLVGFESDDTVRAYDLASGAEQAVLVDDPTVDGVSAISVW